MVVLIGTQSEKKKVKSNFLLKGKKFTLNWNWYCWCWLWYSRISFQFNFFFKNIKIICKIDWFFFYLCKLWLQQVQSFENCDFQNQLFGYMSNNHSEKLMVKAIFVHQIEIVQKHSKHQHQQLHRVMLIQLESLIFYIRFFFKKNCLTLVCC